jgi:hypothetical protein
MGNNPSKDDSGEHSVIEPILNSNSISNGILPTLEDKLNNIIKLGEKLSSIKTSLEFQINKANANIDTKKENSKETIIKKNHTVEPEKNPNNEPDMDHEKHPEKKPERDHEKKHEMDHEKKPEREHEREPERDHERGPDREHEQEHEMEPNRSCEKESERKPEKKWHTKVIHNDSLEKKQNNIDMELVNKKRKYDSVSDSMDILDNNKKNKSPIDYYSKTCLKHAICNDCNKFNCSFLHEMQEYRGYVIPVGWIYTYYNGIPYYRLTWAKKYGMRFEHGLPYEIVDVETSNFTSADQYTSHELCELLLQKSTIF